MYKRAAVPLLTLLLIISFLLSSGLTLASWRSEGSTINSITVGSVSGHIIEEYEQGQTLSPAATVTKKVQVENTGTLDVAVRVKVEKVWGDYRDKSGQLVVNHTLSTDNIQIDYNTSDWFYQNDGYFYYKGVLSPNEMTPALFDSFTIDGETTGGAYKNKSADIIVTMELVQAAYHGISYWGMSFEDLGITYSQTEEIPVVTTVNFNGASKGFSFETNNGDLFANFKNLIPGDSRSQVVTVTNRWNKQTEIFLNATFVEQTASEETRSLVERLLHEYAIITVSDNRGEMIYRGPIYGNYDIEPNGTNSMKYPISLGKFKADETKNLYISLSVDTAMNNEYKDLLGLIRWSFSAEGNEGIIDDPSIDVPITGDNVNTMIYAGVAIISFVMLIIIRRKSKKTEK